MDEAMGEGDRAGKLALLIQSPRLCWVAGGDYLVNTGRLAI
jgi:hypothetical protein